MSKSFFGYLYKKNLIIRYKVEKDRNEKFYFK